MIYSWILQVVYTEVYKAEESVELTNIRMENPKVGKVSDRLGILRVSRQAHTETVAILYSENQSCFYMDRRIPNSQLQHKRTASSIQHVAMSTEFRCHFKQRRSCHVMIRGYLGSSTGYPSSILALERLLSMFQAVTIGLFAALHGIYSFRDMSEI